MQQQNGEVQQQTSDMQQTTGARFCQFQMRRETRATTEQGSATRIVSWIEVVCCAKHIYLHWSTRLCKSQMWIEVVCCSKRFVMSYFVGNSKSETAANLNYLLSLVYKVVCMPDETRNPCNNRTGRCNNRKATCSKQRGPVGQTRATAFRVGGFSL